jgi:hypothetical protein
MKNFSWYEQTGILIPGASFVLGLIAPFPKNEKRSQKFHCGFPIRSLAVGFCLRLARWRRRAGENPGNADRTP